MGNPAAPCNCSKIPSRPRALGSAEPVRREHPRIVGLRRGYKCVTPTSNSAAAPVKIALLSVRLLHNPLASMLLSGAIDDGETVRVTMQDGRPAIEGSILR